MDGLAYLPCGGPTPILDGRTPVFVQVGADPTAGAGLNLPPGSIALFGSTYYWKSGAGATAWTIAPFTAGGAASTWELVEALTIAGAAVQEQAFAAALDGDADGEYLVRARIKNSAAGNGNIGVDMNGNALVYSQFGSQDGANPTGAANGQFGFFYATGSLQLHVQIFARRITGQVRSGFGFVSAADDLSATARLAQFGCGFYTGTDNITEVSIRSSVAAGIGIGSVLELWKWPAA